MAPERAPTIAAVIQKSFSAGGNPELPQNAADFSGTHDDARMAPVKANGKANTEWENFIILKKKTALFFTISINFMIAYLTRQKTKDPVRKAVSFS